MSYTNTKPRRFGRIFLTILVILALFILAFLFAGCSTATVTEPDPAASSAAAPVEETETPEPPAIPVFGETVTYSDGKSISVSTPAAFTPSETAMGQVEGQSYVVFEFVITNNSTENFDPTLVYATASSGGVEASGIFDTEQQVGFPPTTTVRACPSHWATAPRRPAS